MVAQSTSSTCEAVSAVESCLPTVPFPIEYKRGRPKSHDADRVQLCAQALCLEEMLAVLVPAGALFYGKTRRRQDVAFDSPLRWLTEGNCPASPRTHRLGPHAAGRLCGKEMREVLVKQPLPAEERK